MRRSGVASGSPVGREHLRGRSGRLKGQVWVGQLDFVTHWTSTVLRTVNALALAPIIGLENCLAHVLRIVGVHHHLELRGPVIAVLVIAGGLARRRSCPA